MRSSWKSVVYKEDCQKFDYLKKNLRNFRFLFNLRARSNSIVFAYKQTSELEVLQWFKIFSSFFLEGKKKERKVDFEEQVWTKSQNVIYFDYERPYRVRVYNGRTFVSILMTEMKKGGRFGEFIMTKGKLVARPKSVKKV